MTIVEITGEIKTVHLGLSAPELFDMAAEFFDVLKRDDIEEVIQTVYVGTCLRGLFFEPGVKHSPCLVKLNQSEQLWMN